MITSSDSFKDRLSGGRPVFGSWLSWYQPQMTEMMGKAGFDFLVVDMEHSPQSSAEMLHQIQITSLTGATPVVRVGDHSPLGIKRALDAGAEGIIVPMVNTAEQAKRAVEAVYYPPRGTRGVGLNRAQGFGLEFDTYRDTIDERLVVIAQIEHIEAVDNLSAILEVDGIDAYIVGPYDMSGSVGKPGRFEDPQVAQALDRVGEFLKQHPKPGGFHLVHPDHDAVKRRLQQGARFMAYGTDMVLFAHMLQREMSAIETLLVDGE